MSENQITQALLVALIKELIESKAISGDRIDDAVQILSISAKSDNDEKFVKHINDIAENINLSRFPD